MRLISDIKKLTKTEKAERFLFVVDIDKSFDSLDHNYLVSILQKSTYLWSKSEIERLTIFDHCYLYSTYSGGIIFFLKDTVSIKQMANTSFHVSSV